METTLISEINPISKQEARFVDNGHSAWLYLTKPYTPVVIADSWVYNRIPPPDESEIVQFKTASPPAVSGYAHLNAKFTPLQSDYFELKWSSDGRSVALLINNIPFAFIPEGLPRGYSKHLLKNGLWGRKWDEQLYCELFNEPG